MAAKTTAATEVGAGLKTPGNGAFSDPVQVGQMIQQMYPEYKQFDPAVIGQRWIAKHAPQPAAGTSSDVLLSPGASMAGAASTNTTPNTPDLSGLSRFASPIQQPKPQPKPLSLTSGLNALSSSVGGVNTMGQANIPYSVQPQVQQQKPQPQGPQGLSTFDISKVRF